MPGFNQSQLHSQNQFFSDLNSESQTTSFFEGKIHSPQLFTRLKYEKYDSTFQSLKSCFQSSILFKDFEGATEGWRSHQPDATDSLSLGPIHKQTTLLGLSSTFRGPVDLHSRLTRDLINWASVTRCVRLFDRLQITDHAATPTTCPGCQDPILIF